MKTKNILGIDIGGTNINAGILKEGILSKVFSKEVNAKGSEASVLNDLFSVIDEMIDSSIDGIGIGVPGLIDFENEWVFDVVNIPSWKKIPLKKIIEAKYGLPVLINNDANCFALGEFYFGKGKGYNSMVGLTIGTGLGSGLILNKKLYSGKYSGAGEFGMVPYLDHCYEYYASGQFFKNVYNTSGEVTFKNALNGDQQSIIMFEEMGKHLGNAIKMIQYALDVEIIIIGGSVRHAFPFFSRPILKQLESFVFTKSIEGLKIEVSELENAGILGAASLFMDSK